MRRRGNVTAIVAAAVLALSSFAAAGATGKPPVTADCAALAPGATGPAVATVQQAVAATPDGDFGPRTAAAVKTWQRRHKVKVTGVVDAATWRALPAAVAAVACGQRAGGKGVAATCATLRVGSVGPAVAVLQRRLSVTADGEFGPLTRTAVLATQRRDRVRADGVVDAATWTALGLTGTPACVAAPGAVATGVTSAGSGSGAAKPGTSKPPAPAPRPADAAQQAKVHAQVLALAAGLPKVAGTTTSPLARKALAFATAQTGKPYQWGGVGPKGFDCSGLVMTAYQAAGITTPRVAADQYGFGTAVRLDQVQQGDLLFYAMDLTKPATIYHVVMYAGHGTIVDAPYTGAFVGSRSLWTDNLLPVAWRPYGSLVLPVRPGTTGWSVAQLQQALDRHGAKLTVDGGFGPLTTAALKSWQGSHHLAATGVADLQTWLTL